MQCFEVVLFSNLIQLDTDEEYGREADRPEKTSVKRRSVCLNNYSIVK